MVWGACMVSALVDAMIYTMKSSCLVMPNNAGRCAGRVGRHRYFHNLYALDAVLPDLGRPTKAMLEKAMTGYILGQAELVGTYEKQR